MQLGLARAFSMTSAPGCTSKWYVLQNISGTPTCTQLPSALRTSPSEQPICDSANARQSGLPALPALSRPPSVRLRTRATPPRSIEMNAHKETGRWCVGAAVLKCFDASSIGTTYGPIRNSKVGIPRSARLASTHRARRCAHLFLPACRFVPFVPTGTKHGVSITPCGVYIRPTRAREPARSTPWCAPQGSRRRSR